MLTEMKTIATTFLVLGLSACILSISSADNSTDTKPGGSSSDSSLPQAPSINDISMAADPSEQSSILWAPISISMNMFYYIWSYAIVAPINLALSLAIIPITLPLKAITIPSNLVFGDFLKPVRDFIGNLYQMTKNGIWYLVLESISYGSGATADTVSEAAQLALNGFLTFFTDIGLPIANSAEKLSVLTDQLATSRRKRSVTSAFGSLGSGIGQLIGFPFRFMGGIFSIITYPFRVVFGLVMFPYYFLFGSGGDSTYTLLSTDMSTQMITNKVLEAGWDFMKQTGFPELDSIAKQLMENQMIPENIGDMIKEFDSMYTVAKRIGYVQ